MLSPLSSRRPACTDDSLTISPSAVRYEQKPLFHRIPDRDLPVLLIRVIGIGVGYGERVEEYGCRFLERDPMDA
jgi:hypothetical protein